MNSLNILSQQIYEDNKKRGFDVSKENIGQTLMLIVSELSEALEADRISHFALNDLFDYENSDYTTEQYKEQFEICIKDSFEDEIADAIIRLFDLVGALNIDIEKHIEMKLKYNSTREYKHGKRY